MLSTKSAVFGDEGDAHHQTCLQENADCDTVVSVSQEDLANVFGHNMQSFPWYGSAPQLGTIIHVDVAVDADVHEDNDVFGIPDRTVWADSCMPCATCIPHHRPENCARKKSLAKNLGNNIQVVAFFGCPC